MKGRYEKIRDQLIEHGFFGAKTVGKAPSGNNLLRLNRNYPLGPRGTIIELPEDRVIFERVRVSGRWEEEISEFLAEGLNQPKYGAGKSTLIDIGANCGLITLQAMRRSRGVHEYLLFEPLPVHVEAIISNLGIETPGVRVFPFALSTADGFAELQTEKRNYGNSSLVESAIAGIEGNIGARVETVDTALFFEVLETDSTNFVIKSDTQGMDAEILSRIPGKIWKQTDRAVVEVWALPDVEETDVSNLLGHWEFFERISWNQDFSVKVSLMEIADFWLSKSRRQRNLFIARDE